MDAADTGGDVESTIDDREEFYRRVGRGASCYQRDEGGEVRVSQSAFADRSLEPSVDRKRILQGHDLDAVFTAGGSANGVLRIVASDVRGITVSTNDAKGRWVSDHAADLEPRPIPENDAHCVVLLSPAVDQKGTFRRLCERLANLARWEILPEDVRTAD